MSGERSNLFGMCTSPTKRLRPEIEARCGLAGAAIDSTVGKVVDNLTAALEGPPDLSNNSLYLQDYGCESIACWNARSHSR